MSGDRPLSGSGKHDRAKLALQFLDSQLQAIRAGGGPGLEQAQAEVAAKKQELEETRGRMFEEQEALRQAQLESADLARSQLALLKNADAITEQLERARTELGIRREQARALETRVKDEEAALSAARTELVDLEARLLAGKVETERRAAELAKTSSAIERRREELEGTQAIVGRSIEGLAAANEQLAVLERALQQTKGDVETSQATLTTRERQVEELKARVDALVAERREAKRRLAEGDKEIPALEVKIKEGEQEAKEIVARTALQSAAREAVEARKRQVDEARKQARDKEQEVTEHVQTLESIVAAGVRELESMRTQLVTKLEALAKAEHQLALLKEAARQGHQELREVEGQLKKATEAAAKPT